MSEQENRKIVKTCGQIGEKFGSSLCGRVSAEWTGEVSGKGVRSGREDDQWIEEYKCRLVNRRIGIKERSVKKRARR